ncbi:MAG TPA: SH3 domain-containing protein [Thermoanaerobaculia bacterium]|nr:SH3 domain-containing protein [Thermoanaerobaculia bacterium]
MLNRIAPLLLLIALACGERPAAVPAAREPIAIRFVVADELPIHESKSAESPVLSTYQAGERVSVLADDGEWSEIRITFDTSGWAKKSLLGDAPAGDTATTGAGSASPRFKVPPSPVFSPGGAKGEIVLEATVNTDGDVAAVKTIVNTTGRADLEAQNVAALRQAKFHPMIIAGTRKAFIYEHRITY